MPKRLKPLSGAWVDPVLRSCSDKAGRAVGKRSPLTDGDILFLAELVCNHHHLLLGCPMCDEDGNFPGGFKKDDISAEKGQALGWIFFRDPVGAARAVAAAHKEADRIKRTALWAVRSVIRDWSLKMSLNRVLRRAIPPHDIQTITEMVKAESGFTVSRRLIHKAFALERSLRKSIL